MMELRLKSGFSALGAGYVVLRHIKRSLECLAAMRCLKKNDDEYPMS